MRRLFTLPLLALLIAGCAHNSSGPQAKQPPIVGTWKWISVNKQPVDQPFYARYYPNGIAASWPAPEGLFTTNGVSVGRYRIEDEHLVIEVGAGIYDPRVRMKVSGNELKLTNNKTNHLVYRRVVPDLDPGKYPAATNQVATKK